MPKPAISNEDAAISDGLDTTGTEDAFLKRMMPDADKKPSDDADDAHDKADTTAEDDNADNDADNEADADDTDDKSSDEADDEGSEDEGNDDNVVLKDDYKIKVPVDGEEREFTLGSLKRLAGQEAALTRKSQEVATKRKALDTQAAAQVAQLQTMVERATKRYEPYSKINFLALAKDPNISSEEIQALQEAATSAYQDLQFLQSEQGAFAQALKKQRDNELAEQAAEAVKVLSDPEKGIQGWNQQVYTDIVNFAVSEGISQEIINELVDPFALKIIHKAMLYERGKKQVKTEPGKKKAPAKIVKGTSNADATKDAAKSKKTDDVRARLRKTGNAEDAEDAFMAKWGIGD